MTALVMASDSHGAAAQTADSAMFAGMKARAIGPAAMSGRVASIDAVVSDPRIIYVGAATGGVWKSVDAGLSWTPIFDDQDTASIGAVAVFQPNPDVVWVGTGEGNPRNSTSVGRGLYKSLDGGETFTKVGLEKTERIHRIIPHPTNPDIVYVGALGRAWGENPERGVYKTTDGGASWSRILFVDERTGVGDLVMDPSNPDHLIAAMWDYRRWPWAFRSGGPGSGLHATYDGGETWTRLTEDDGLPKGELGRIGLAFAPSEPDTVYAIVEANEKALIKSTDGGASWSTVNTEPRVAYRPFYFNDLEVDPVRPERVYRQQFMTDVSIDGGKSFAPAAAWPGVHPDHHAIWIHPRDPNHVIIGNDGGVAISRDRGATWRFVRNLPLAQFYHMRVDNAEPYNIYGGLQDNGSWRGPSEVWDRGGIRNHHWKMVAFGDGFDTIPDPEDPTKGYAMSQAGYLVRWDAVTGESKLIRPPAPDSGERLRFNWNAGFAQDPFAPATIYYGSQFVHRSLNRGEDWEVISEDLTTDEEIRTRQAESGGLTIDVSGAENNATITVIAPSAIAQDVLWVGTDDGRLHLSSDGGDAWTSLESRFPRDARGAWIEHIEPSPHDADTAFVAMTDHRRSNWTPYLFKVDRGGRRIVNIGDGIDGFVRSVVQDPVDPNLLFAGSEFGLWVSFDGGGSWMKWTEGVPPASVKDLAIQERESDLVIATHGRGIYVLDDIDALRNMDSGAMRARAQLLDVTNAQQYRTSFAGYGEFAPGDGEFRGPNEPYGAVFTFVMNGDDLRHPDPAAEKTRRERRRLEDAEPEGADQKVLITILDAEGARIRTMEIEPHQGVNRAVWDLKGDPLPGLADATNPAQSEWEAPESPPGAYEALFRFEDYEARLPVMVKPDPRFDLPPNVIAENYTARREVFAMMTDVHAMAKEALEAKSDLERLKAKAQARIDEAERLAKLAGAEPPADDAPLPAFAAKLGETLKALDAMDADLRVRPWEAELRDDEELTASAVGLAMWMVSSHYGAPTSTQRVYMRRAADKLAEHQDRHGAFFAEDLATIRAEAERLGLGWL